MVLGAWEFVIGKRYVWPDENTILQRNAVEQTHAIFDRHIVPDDNGIFDETVGADVDMRADDGVLEYDTN